MCPGQFALWNNYVLNCYALAFLSTASQFMACVAFILIVVLAFVSPYWPSPRGREKAALQRLDKLESRIADAQAKLSAIENAVRKVG